MTQNYHTESILINGMTVRNLIHDFSIWGPSGVSWILLPPSYGARVQNVLRSGRSVVLKICIGMFEVGHPPGVSRREVTF